MTLQYRAYLVGANGIFQSAEAFEAASDAAALVHAQQFALRGNVEVWQLDRKIALLRTSLVEGAGRVSIEPASRRIDLS
ncbi:hypothetical protein [Bradyrhizobium arachidis]|uniref:Uncharacterized protein n=1 Tax=Bradyrhizobium arachidis TaxID=858423 RepID=A0AAE7NSE0_9BRAD|nr:hypothetical protein [Bradyrhizobium arachidis]QOZ67864.1 hypothetical protein WN72_17285 [Bradyrhizobium arachidis]SFV10434.1 hypothetical protein SAMN05192541_11611 [Bradyrhizobium arachidis]